MISAVLFILLALAIFCYIVAPFFDDFQKIVVAEMKEEIKNYAESNLEEFENDFENGKIGEKELNIIKVNFEKEMKK